MPPSRSSRRCCPPTFRAVLFLVSLWVIGAPAGEGTVEAASPRTLYRTIPPWEAARAVLPVAAVHDFLEQFRHLTLSPFYLEGELVGYTIQMAPGSGHSAQFLTDLGLQNGDTLLAINAVVLTSITALHTALDVLGRASLLQIILLRDDTRLVLNYDVQ